MRPLHFQLYHAVTLLMLSLAMGHADPGGFLQMRNGYFWDPQAQDYFVARGIAYQLWNPPVGANQSFDQLTYDLTEFKKIYANSVRCEMVWSQLETAEGKWDWRKPDYLVSEAERLGFRLFVLIGFQYPPAWFPKELRAINSLGLTPEVMQCLAASTPGNALGCFPAMTRDQLIEAIPPNLLPVVQNALVLGAKEGSVTNVLARLEAGLPSGVNADVSALLISDVINYEHPQARAIYAAHLAALTARYKNSTAIGAWIMGNEYAYFDLWENPDVYPAHRFIGFDALSQEHYRSYLQSTYGDIATLNQKWNTTYADFSKVIIPSEYPPDRTNSVYFDLIQWRKKSIGDFVAAGAVAARNADPNHLQTYSMVGGVFSGLDANNSCEDAKTIVARCRLAGVPLDFWSINNYANAALGSELRSADFGIAKYQEESGLPVMISETGHSSTEELFDFPNAGLRQAKADPGQMWEALVSGVIGTHLFHWNDRSQFVQGYFLRERGFGIVGQNRAIKPGVYTNIVNMFRRMEELKIQNLLGGSTNPPVDVQFFWSTNADLVWPRANQENAMLWGALRRLGYQPGIIGDVAFESGAYSNAPALLLSRCFAMDPTQLQEIASRVLPAGIHVHANADLPGQFDQYSQLNPNWNNLMSSIFGLDTSKAYRGLHAWVNSRIFGNLSIQGLKALSPLSASYAAEITSWEIWHDVGVTDGTIITTQTGLNGTQPKIPALVTKSHGAASGKTAINTFALGDSGVNGGIKENGWDLRSAWLRAIYQTSFGITPPIRLSGVGSTYVIPDYRICRNGSILLSLLNEGTNSASVTVTAAGLLQGKTVENLTDGGIVDRQSNGVLTIDMAGDDYVLFYAYSDGGGASSLIEASPYRVWFESAPVIIHPRLTSYPISLGFDTQGAQLELGVDFESSDGTVLSQSVPITVGGKDQKNIQITVPDADPENPSYLSSAEGGSYFLRATLSANGTVVGQSRIPVRLAWAVRPVQELPVNPAPGTYTAELEWNELPSEDPADPTPFDRVLLWDSINETSHAYAITLNLRNSNGVVASKQVVTRFGTGSANFSITVPANAPAPLAWSADVRPVTSLLSHDVWEGFEANERGAMWPSNLTASYAAPWLSFKYSSTDQDLWQNEGVQLSGSEGSQSAFLVVTNVPGLAFSGFGFKYVFPEGPWALPQNHQEWTNWLFSFDFREDHGYPCDVQMQIKNSDPQGTGKWLQFSVPYQPQPGTNGWAHVAASLDQFSSPGLSGIFDPSQVSEIVLNAAMKQASVQYVGSFDNIRFDGPDTVLALGEPIGTYNSANDSAGYLQVELTAAGTLKISWTGTGKLESAATLDGPWSLVRLATNPQEVSFTRNSQFYRLRR